MCPILPVIDFIYETRPQLEYFRHRRMERFFGKWISNYQISMSNIDTLTRKFRLGVLNEPPVRSRMQGVVEARLDTFGYPIMFTSESLKL